MVFQYTLEHFSASLPSFQLRRASHFDALHGFVDAFQQGLVLRALEAVLVGVHVRKGVHVAVKVLLCDWLLLRRKWQAGSVKEAWSGGAGWKRGETLTMCGRRMLARLRMRARLRPDSSTNRASFCSSIILFSCSMLFRFFSMEEICNRQQSGHLCLRSLQVIVKYVTLVWVSAIDRIWKLEQMSMSSPTEKILLTKWSQVKSKSVWVNVL